MRRDSLGNTLYEAYGTQINYNGPLQSSFGIYGALGKEGYDGKEYDLKILLTRAMILNIDLSDLWSFQHIDLFDFLKKSTRLGRSNIFDVAGILQCESVGNQSQKEELKMVSPTVLAAEARWKDLETYNNTMLSVIYEIFQKIKPYLFPEFRTDLLDSQPSQEGIFG